MSDESQEVKEKGAIPVPTELEGKDLGTPLASSSINETEGLVSLAEPDGVSASDKLNDYAKHLHSYIREYISVADRKASFVFTIGAALLVYLYEKGVVVSWLKTPNTWSFWEIIAFLAISGLSLSCVLAVAVVFPKLKGSKHGFIFWESIAKFETSAEFSDSAQNIAGIGLTRELLRHAHELAKVCKDKYRVLNWSLRAGSVGAVATILYLVKG